MLDALGMQHEIGIVSQILKVDKITLISHGILQEPKAVFDHLKHVSREGTGQKIFGRHLWPKFYSHDLCYTKS
jgi:hypothetical protein